ncbi:MAG: hypothetical protein JWR00_293 [Rubritepida sp.]|nr:hypothetical protein [Rubritepida sp.]
MAEDLWTRVIREMDQAAEQRWLTSPLAEWMAERHDQAAEILSHQHLSWAKAAEAFAAYGLKDQLGRPPTAETARETWQRVEERRRARAQKIPPAGAGGIVR